MKYTFQHYYDIQTSADSLTMIQIQAGGIYTLQRIKHLIGAYKYLKLGSVSVKFLPASTLPVDPLGLSYNDDDPQTVDPRDQMNPGLVRITNGEDLMTDFTGLSDKAQEQIYINTMLDPRWSKFMLQRGFKRTAVPLYWNIGQLHQDTFPGSHINAPIIRDVGSSAPFAESNGTFHLYEPNTLVGDAIGNVRTIWDDDNSDPRGLFQVGHRGRMGWMPTDAFAETLGYTSQQPVELVYTKQPLFQPIPAVNVITAILPKQFKTVYYYRMFITETVYLKGLKNTGINILEEQIPYEYQGVDNFVNVPYPTLSRPDEGQIRRLPRPFNDGEETHD